MTTDREQFEEFLRSSTVFGVPMGAVLDDMTPRRAAEIAIAWQAARAAPAQPSKPLSDDEIAARSSKLDSVRSLPQRCDEDLWPAVERALLDVARLFAAQPSKEWLDEAMRLVDQCIADRHDSAYLSQFRAALRENSLRNFYGQAMNTKLNSRPAHAHSKLNAAWWYENARSIDVYIYVAESGTDAVACRILRSDLLDWIKRTTPKGKRHD